MSDKKIQLILKHAISCCEVAKELDKISVDDSTLVQLEYSHASKLLENVEKMKCSENDKKTIQSIREVIESGLKNKVKKPDLPPRNSKKETTPLFEIASL